MKTNLLRLAVVTAIVSLALTAANAVEYYEVNTVPDARTKAYRQGEVIVKFKADGPVNVRRNSKGRYQSAGVSAVDNVLQQIGAAEIEPLMPLTGKLPANAPRKAKSFNGTDIEMHDLSKLYCIKAEGNMSVNEMVEKLKALPEVEFAEPNYIVYTCASSAPNDPLYSQQWGIPAVKADKLWDKPAITDKRPVIAILDTGVDIEHPDLAANIWTNTAEANGSEGYDDDGNGFADDIHGWDFVDQCGEMGDYNGHGTHCAGIAAAVGNNGVGICGANPDALIMPIIVMQSDGTGDIATIIKGIDYASANGADVLSMSIGTYAYSLALEHSLGRAYINSVLVAAAGNDGNCIYPFHHQIGPGPMFPAAFTFVFGVQASTDNGELASFSNYDCDGPVYFDPGYYTEEQMYNYELKAPGTNILSTFPGGKYKQMNGTSMACPFVAGSISKFLTIKDILNKEILFGDLIHTSASCVDFEAAYDIEDSDRKPYIRLVTWRIEDESDNDGRFDAGEIINFYPTVRNEWGTAKNIKVWIELAELEKDVIEVLSDKAEFDKPLSGYGKAESSHPFRFRVKDNVTDGRHCRIVIYVQCDGMEAPNAQEIVFIAENGVEIGGIIDHDMTLEPGVHYIVTKKLIVTDPFTLTILPGSVIKFGDNTGMAISNPSNLVAKGTAENPILFTHRDNVSYPVTICDFGNSELEYCHFECLVMTNGVNEFNMSRNVSFKNCYFRDMNPYFYYGNFDNCTLEQCFDPFLYNGTCFCTNVVNCMSYTYPSNGSIFDISYCQEINSSNIFNSKNNENNEPTMYLKTHGSSIGLIKFPKPFYFGSTKETIIRNYLFDNENPLFPLAGWKFDLSNMLTQPNPDAHGILWKVLVNGYDAQDEFDMLPPLGVGRHKFEVWYSKKIDESVAPVIAMGVRPPYTQTAIAEDGSWRTITSHYVVRDSEGNITDERDIEHSVYTAYIDIKGSMAIDGLNRIYVSGCQDLVGFDIPLENVRFNVEVSAAGSMSTGFFATPGVGKVDLEWEDLDMNVEDIMGYNLYRIGERETTEWGYDEDWNWVEKPVTVTDTIRVNQRLIDEPKYTDFDVVPGMRYDYYYKVMRTDMAETSPSKVVSVVPLTATKGDANGSLSVDVADVVTEISYMTGGNPQPFIYEAADVNSDEEINILDVVGTINIIVKPSGVRAMSDGGLVKYWLTDGILYMENDVTLGGLQFCIDNAEGVRALEALDGFETVNSSVDGQVIFLAYSMVGRTLAPGTYAIAAIDGDGTANNVVCSDSRGHNVVTMQADMDGMAVVEIAQMRLPNPNPFTDDVNIPFVIGDNATHRVEIRFCDFTGRQLDRHAAEYGYGEHSYTWRPAVQSGIYLASLYIDGALVQSAKLVKK